MAVEFPAGQHKSKGQVRAVVSELCRGSLCYFSVLRTPFGKDSFQHNWPLRAVARLYAANVKEAGKVQLRITCHLRVMGKDEFAFYRDAATEAGRVLPSRIFGLQWLTSRKPVQQEVQQSLSATS